MLVGIVEDICRYNAFDLFLRKTVNDVIINTNAEV